MYAIMAWDTVCRPYLCMG